MKYNKPKHIKTDKPKRFKPPEGLNHYKEVSRFEEEYIKINRINEKKNKRKQGNL